ncbi:MAG: hypothetical protein NPMRTH1_1190009 [Nitrosopumilales archaeon]|nr:MAG: hypothetical protein NPMRTH1_1190009 [Nitrosopumilales archaeon]
MATLQKILEPDQFVEEILKISPLIRFSAIYFEGNFYTKTRDDVETYLDSYQTTKSMRYAVMRMIQREEHSQKIGNVHYALAKYDKVNRVTIPLGKDGLIMFSTELEAECDSIAEKVIEFKKKNEHSINV